MIKEPKRLRVGSDELATSIGQFRAQGPSEERLAALAGRLTEAGARVEGGAAPVAHAAPKFAVAREPGAQLLAKLFDPGTLAVVAALVVGAGIIAVALMIREADAPLTPPPALSPVLVPASADRAPAAVERPVPPRPTNGSENPLPPSPAERERGAAAGMADGPPSGVTAAPPSTPPIPPLGDAPNGTASTGGGVAPRTPELEPAGSGAAAKRGPKSKSRSVTSDVNSGAPLADDTAHTSELDLLKAARSALAVDPLQAFALSERCRAQYPSGSFAQERDYIAISALVRLGRNEEARSRAALFRMHYPSSAYLPRLELMLGEK